VKRGILGLFAALALLVPVRAAAAPTIQPGDEMDSSVGGCTLGFVVDGGGQTYFMSAAHCVDHIGELVTLRDGTPLGTAAAIGSAKQTTTDWSLIRVKSFLRTHVSGAVRGHPDMPKGVATAGHTKTGDLIEHSGYGVPWFVSSTLREQRVGVLIQQSAQRWISIGPDTNGDSGGPVAHVSSRKALGLVSRLCIGPCTSEGPTVEGILLQASARLGVRLRLRTV
jgi:hypothetical protein